jgi:hypothetical protein
MDAETRIFGCYLDNTMGEPYACQLDYSVCVQPFYPLLWNRLSFLSMLLVPKSITRSFFLAVMVLSLALVVAGCSSGVSHSDKPTTNQALQPGAGTPSFCKDLASNTDISNLPQALRAAATGDSAAVAQLKAAAAALRRYAADGLGTPATKTADALDVLATSPQDQTALNNFVSATTELDTRMRTVCHTT